ncbi:tryptophan halogenase family protein [Aliiglaciecola sp. M165]|uniref:tryptophan halogenase family protein n=1 Tax=Aliiglaciecola sp. M165 TaxID=2593649 RepID=UPI001C8F7740|nr:tryptophan halogenase family protein [Aliiglaciecola sp. M165]
MIPQTILIVGGGTAGWMSANLLKKSWPTVKITLVESDSIGTIGVGEGSTPFLKQFFKRIGASEREWMPQCFATYKAGIEFSRWSEKPGFTHYFHPFFSQLDIKPAEPFFHNAKLQRQGIEADAHPDAYFVNAQMAKQCKAPLAKRRLNFDLDYGYHFDAGRLGLWLKDRAIADGVEHIIDDVTQVEVRDSGEIAAVIGAKSGRMAAELYVDCSGFKGLLIQQALSVPFKSYKQNLFNDAAVAIQTPLADEQDIPTRTLSTALTNGWAWEIPLTNRVGNGYVYSSEHISGEQAEVELRRHLGLADDTDISAKHLKMKVGRVEQHWAKNCLAVGLSQGFIEPLEATALMLVQFTLEKFVTAKQSLQQESLVRDNYNADINKMMEGIRDYIVTHYALNSRTDSDYWRRCREDIEVSDNLQALFQAWKSHEQFESELNKQASHLVYLRPSWYVIMAGMGNFPMDLLTPSQGQVAPVNLSKQYCIDLVEDLFPSHKAVLSQLAAG